MDTLLEIGLRWNDSRTRLSLSFAELRTFVGELLVLYKKEKNRLREARSNPQLNWWKKELQSTKEDIWKV
ncbi:hypothetical protein LEP1GSC043_4598 [Leptospira weilii str. Ecochallenge]|uniref:Uncharacterized protein n=1 Tax=Leptospira weilii str. Ecochallenge TaxID=1049986 RepID=N1UC51_9LEPT|nr:hypothetical protein LEP1GSC043_4598 [Leptospira weilii str. Ecochallenge]